MFRRIVKEYIIFDRRIMATLYSDSPMPLKVDNAGCHMACGGSESTVVPPNNDMHRLGATVRAWQIREWWYHLLAVPEVAPRTCYVCPEPATLCLQRDDMLYQQAA